jgi:hypothetical protein
MVLSQPEMEMLNHMLQGAQNVSVYSYEVAVKGTVIDGAATLLCTAIALIITIISGVFLLKAIKREGEKDIDSFAPLFVIGIIALFVTYIIVHAAIWIGFHDALMNVYAPEYMVIKHILDAASTMTAR